MYRKLKSNRGESLAEVLLASLVISLGFVLFATMVQASSRMVKDSIDHYDAYLEVVNHLENATEFENLVVKQSNKPTMIIKVTKFNDLEVNDGRNSNINVDVYRANINEHKIGTYVYEKTE